MYLHIKMEEVKQRKPKVSKYTDAEKLVRVQQSHQRYYEKNKEKIKERTKAYSKKRTEEGYVSPKKKCLEGDEKPKMGRPLKKYE